MEFKVEGLDSAETCDLVKNQIMTLEGIVEVVADPYSQVLHVKLNDSCSCSVDDVQCMLKDLGLGVNP